MQDHIQSMHADKDDDKAMDTSTPEIDEADAKQSNVNGTDVPAHNLQSETNGSKADTTSEPEHVDPFQSLPLCMDPKVIDMVMKGVLVIPESKVHELPPGLQRKIKEQCTDDKEQSTDDIQVIQEIPADGFGDKFQVVRNTATFSSPGHQVSVAEWQKKCNFGMTF